MNPGERLAIAARLHVLLRRQTGRVTDPEWMANNREYAAAMIRFARAKSTELGVDNLAEWATKLEAAMAQPDAKVPVPLVQAAAAAIRQSRMGGVGEERQAAMSDADAAAQDLTPPTTDFGGLENVSPSSRFTETGFGESVIDGRRVAKKGGDAERYVGGLR